MFGILRDVFGENKSLLEEAINLAEFPEDRNEDNRNYEEQKLDAHLLAFSRQEIVNSVHLTDGGTNRITGVYIPDFTQIPCQGFGVKLPCPY